MEKLDEKFVKSAFVYDGCLLKVYADTVVLPNGKKARREVVRHPGAVAVVPVLGDGRIVMVRQYRYPVDGTLLEIPAGKLDPGESPDHCVLRELSEETGYIAGITRKLTAIHTAPGFSDELIHIYLAENLEMTRQHTDEDEFINVEIYTKEELRDMISRGLITDAKTIVGLSLADF
ncbi:hypothetical protein P22_0108 [Propionispora sp. 2/2-37]|uniref:NUDIX domain-containing protein n=1 Tax=Propionispora sp. 2/2-37 TaxID=1677858 RepID=UPI0006BB6902|nr:NUDIX hydrolase [Propionispora sp. 2/2-37]CUH94046.1 hypothetical protein P22_0108 [Propionispora sp. 2/2-37]